MEKHRSAYPGPGKLRETRRTPKRICSTGARHSVDFNSSPILIFSYLTNFQIRVFLENQSSGILQRPDLFSTIARNVQVYRKDVQCFTFTAISLANKDDPRPDKILVDAIVYATGWKAVNRLYSPYLALSLGLPILLAEQDIVADGRLKELESSKDAAILSRFPILIHPHKYQYRAPHHSPFSVIQSHRPVIGRKKPLHCLPRQSSHHEQFPYGRSTSAIGCRLS